MTCPFGRSNGYRRVPAWCSARGFAWSVSSGCLLEASRCSRSSRACEELSSVVRSSRREGTPLEPARYPPQLYHSASVVHLARCWVLRGLPAGLLVWSGATQLTLPPLVGPTRGRAATHSGPLGGRHQLKLRLAHSACSINSTALPLSTWLLRPVCVPRRVPAVPTAPCRPTWPCWGGLYRTSSTASGILQSTASDPNGSRIFTVRLIVSTATVHPRRGSSRPANAIRYHVGVGAGRLRHHFMGLRAW